MEPYVSFPNDAIMDGVTPQEGFLEDQTGVAIPRNGQPPPIFPPKRSPQKRQHLQRLPTKKQPPMEAP